MAGLKLDVAVKLDKLVKLKDEIEATKKEIQRLQQAGDEKGAAKLTKSLNKLSREYATIRDNVVKATDAMRNSGSQMSKTDSEVRKITSSLLKLGGAALSLNFAKDLVSQMVKVRSEMQMLETSFDVLLQGKGTKEFMNQLKQFAVDSPLSLSGVSGAAQTLLGFNVEAEKVVDTIKQIGDISMGDEQRFQSLSLAFAQTTAAGKLMGQDLNQMINAGFNPLQEIAAKTGKSISALREEMAAGAISSDMVAQAFASATAEGGRFYGMTQKQAQGLAGLQAQLTGAIEEAFNNIGKSQEGIIAGGYKMATTLVENYKQIGEALFAIAAGYGVYKAASMAVTTVENARVSIMENQLSIEAKINLSKLNLVEGSAAYTAAMAAELKVQQEKELVALKEAASIARLNAIRLNSQKIAAQQAVIDAKAAGETTKKIALLEAEISATHKKVIAAKAEAVAAGQAVASKKTDILINTSAVASTNALTVAKTKLAAASRTLGLSKLANPYVLAGAAVAALGYGIYKLVTYQTDLEKAMKRVDKATESFNSSLMSEQTNVDILFGRLKKAEEGTDKYKKAKEAILNQYGLYLEGLNSEIKSLKDVEGAYKAISVAAIQAAKDRAIASGTQEASDTYAKEWGENINKINKEFIKEFGDAQGTLLMDSLKEALSTGTELSPELKQAIEKFNLSYTRAAGPGVIVGTSVRNDVKMHIGQIESARKTFDKEMQLLEGAFGSSSKKIEDDTEVTFGNISKTIQDTVSNITRLKNEIADLRSGKTQVDSTKNIVEVIEKKEEELKAQQSILKTLTGKSEKEENKYNLDKNKLAYETNERIRAIKEAQKKISDAETDGEYEIQQAIIDGMSDGSEKVLMQIQLDAEKRRTEIERTGEEMIKARQEVERKIWEADNPKAKEEGAEFTPTTTTIEQLPKVQQDYLDSMLFLAEEERLKKIREMQEKEQQAWTQYLKEFGDYREKELAITQEYDAKIAKAESESEKTLYESQKKKDIAELGVQVLKTSKIWDKYFNDLEKKSRKSLKDISKQIKDMILYLESGGKKGDAGENKSIFDGILENKDEALKTVDELKDGLKQIEKAKDELSKSNPFGRIIAGFRQLKAAAAGSKDELDSLDSILSGMSEIGNIFGDMGDMLESAGVKIGSSMISISDTISSIVSGAASGAAVGGWIGALVGAVAGAAASIIPQLGKIKEWNDASANYYDSLIDLSDGVIDKNMQIVRSYSSIIDKIEALGKVIDEADKKEDLTREKIRARSGSTGSDTGGHTYGYLNKWNISDQIVVDSGLMSESEVKKLRGKDWANGFIDKVAELQKTGQLQFKENTENNYAELEKANIDIVGLYMSTSKTLSNLTAEQILALQEYGKGIWRALDSETQSYLNSIVEGHEAVKRNLEEMKAEVLGVSLDSFVSEFASMLNDADKKTADFAKSFEDHIREAMIDSLVGGEFKKRLEKIYNDFSDVFSNESSTEEDRKAAVEKARREYESAAEAAQKERDAVLDAFDLPFKDKDSENSLKGAYAKADQESISLLAGYTAAVRVILEDLRRMFVEWYNNSQNNEYYALFANSLAIIQANQVASLKEVTAIREISGRVEVLTYEIRDLNGQIASASSEIAKNTGNTTSELVSISNSGLKLKGAGLGL